MVHDDLGELAEAADAVSNGDSDFTGGRDEQLSGNGYSPGDIDWYREHRDNLRRQGVDVGDY